MEEIIHFYHTNDLHSHLENWPRIQQFLLERKKWHQDVKEEVFVLDIGDHADRWHPFTEGLLGKGNVRLLNEANYDYVTIGNNEGITLPFNGLEMLYNEANFQVLVANLYYQNGERPHWALPYTIYTTKQGTNIAFIGVTAYFKQFYETLGWKLTDPFEELAIQIEKVKQDADVIVLLSHLGLSDDERIAELFPDITVIFGGHTHHILHEGRIVNKSMLCGAGKFGMYVGHVELKLKLDNVPVIRNLKARLYDTNELPKANNEKELIASYIHEGNEKLDGFVTELEEPMPVDWFISNKLIELLCESLREWCEADCAFLNAGLLLEGLPKGPVTERDLHRICPHPINPCLVTLKGSELKEVLLQSLNEEWPHIPLKGLGFRGKIIGKMVYDRVHFQKETGSLTQIFINGKELEPKKNYKLAIPDMFTFGHFFPEIRRSTTKKYYMPEFLRDLLKHKLSKDHVN